MEAGQPPIQPGTYFLVRNKPGCTFILGMDDFGQIITSSNRVANGNEGIRLEPTGNGLFFLTRNKDNGTSIYAVDYNGQVLRISVRDPQFQLRIEQSGVMGVYFIVSLNGKVLACDDHGKVTTTTNKVAFGDEGWRLEFAGQCSPPSLGAPVYPTHELNLNLNFGQQFNCTEPGYYMPVQQNYVQQPTCAQNQYFPPQAVNLPQHLHCQDPNKSPRLHNLPQLPPLATHSDDDQTEAKSPRTYFVTEAPQQKAQKIRPAKKLFNGIYYISRNKPVNYYLAMNDTGKGEACTVTDKNENLSWVEVRIEKAGMFHSGVYFLSKHNTNDGRMFAITNRGIVRTSKRREASGWEGFIIEQAEIPGVYYISRNKNVKEGGRVLGCDDNGVLCATNDKVPDGYEGWKFEFAGKI